MSQPKQDFFFEECRSKPKLIFFKVKRKTGAKTLSKQDIYIYIYIYELGININ